MKKLNSLTRLRKIALRLPLWVLAYIEERAVKENVPYQSLIIPILLRFAARKGEKAD